MADEKWLKEALDKLEGKVDKLDQRLDSVDVTLGQQHIQLSSHIYRTELLEENVSLLRDQIKPIETHIIMLHGVLKAIGLISVIVGLITGVLKILQTFNILP